ncbi:hypothetical protein SEA_MULCH_62 [Gordonia phage Mulch]|uniref:Uncharacterized protein n=5 Tax=Betterkatzvirus betterkatz TaxID=2560485 RepID=A0A2Z5HDN1_9CAUD|nr:hypothetical protein SEA_NADEEM_62 [Gordonia phage Nadeem]AZS11229.1 hypothetical protein PBI_WHEATTHIN_61 [Gordonia phage WheatThin]QAU06859.1 hypothetical protein SEA_BRYLIE_62 [Gordonia phage Brylie]QAX92557.1 hypothetical protein SEA_MULCH_62 [Gordonia phage Mulch]QAY06518.1 hypothetical protein SEA_PARADA_62 [Gordonia phage Parada]
MTNHDIAREALLANHLPVWAWEDDETLLVCCTCGFGADRAGYDGDAHADHRADVLAGAEAWSLLTDVMSAFSTTFAVVADGIADAFRDITETTNKAQAGYDQARDRERAAIPKPATTPPIWANNPNQQRRRNNR